MKRLTVILPLLAGFPSFLLADDSVDFRRQARPILSEHCFKCHGPDAAERKGGLRLDLADAAKKGGESGAPAVVPGDIKSSELVRRILASDPDERMPPASGKPLTEAEKATLVKWVTQGGKYETHWSFTPPARPVVPSVSHSDWPRNPIDRFILARLEKEGIAPSPPADKVTVLRRATLDLTGLPPTPAEVDAFLADPSPAAYERVVERLLASPRYGERMTLDWLDAARFADTHGYHIDSGRDMTRWREWVIDAFNRDMPFDRFTVEQLAGDLLPNPTLSQKIASGFNRNHMINYEGGAIPEEYHAAYVVDRVNTTSTVWLGLTVACAQCHDHKYDPITQKEFYRLYAFFHQVPENGLDGRAGNAAPMIKAPDVAQSRRMTELTSAIATAEQTLDAPSDEADSAQTHWEAGVRSTNVPWSILEVARLRSRGRARFAKESDDSYFASGANVEKDRYTIEAKSPARTITAIRLEALPDPRNPASGPGRSSNGNFVLTNVSVSVRRPDSKKKSTPVAIGRASANFSQDNYAIASAIDKDPVSGWAVYPQVGKAHVAVFEFAEPIKSPKGAELSITLDFNSPFAQHQIGRLRLSATDAGNPRGVDGVPLNFLKIVMTPPAKRTAEQTKELKRYFRAEHFAPMRPIAGRLATLRGELAEFDKAVPSAMVMEDMAKPRDTFLLVRGQYDKKGEKVDAGVPAALPPLPTNAPSNRLGLAQWLVDPRQPLTARVTVNRLWQAFFGTGIVRTAEDFGSQGEQPSHPELLDWLASEFTAPPVGEPWSVKHIVRLIVTSQAYRQSSAARPDLAQRDPDNRLLAAYPRVRLQAEAIRDQALAVCGLLDPRIGGPSVSPYQPDGLWEELAYRQDRDNFTAQVYKQDKGQNLYRRTMYTFWKRTCPPPTLLTFDAPDRETCSVRRSRTNTPLQALILMNDPTYVEAARALAQKLLKGDGADEARLRRGFRLLLAREPSAQEIAVLTRALAEQRARFNKAPAEAEKLLAVGETPRDASLDPKELAAWTMLSSVLLNLDETITKG